MLAKDVVVAVDGQVIDNMSTLVVLLRLHHPGDAVSIDVLRGGKRQSLRVTLAERR
jgi:S1-C subfamily serine protease